MTYHMDWKHGRAHLFTWCHCRGCGRFWHWRKRGNWTKHVHRDHPKLWKKIRNGPEEHMKKFQTETSHKLMTEWSDKVTEEQ